MTVEGSQNRSHAASKPACTSTPATAGAGKRPLHAGNAGARNNSTAGPPANQRTQHIDKSRSRYRSKTPTTSSSESTSGSHRTSSTTRSRDTSRRGACHSRHKGGRSRERDRSRSRSRSRRRSRSRGRSRRRSRSRSRNSTLLSSRHRRHGGCSSNSRSRSRRRSRSSCSSSRSDRRRRTAVSQRLAANDARWQILDSRRNSSHRDMSRSGHQHSRHSRSRSPKPVSRSSERWQSRDVGQDRSQRYLHAASRTGRHSRSRSRSRSRSSWDRLQQLHGKSSKQPHGSHSGRSVRDRPDRPKTDTGRYESRAGNMQQGADADGKDSSPLRAAAHRRSRSRSSSRGRGREHNRGSSRDGHHQDSRDRQQRSRSRRRQGQQQQQQQQQQHTSKRPPSLVSAAAKGGDEVVGVSDQHHRSIAQQQPVMQQAEVPSQPPLHEQQSEPGRQGNARSGLQTAAGGPGSPAAAGISKTHNDWTRDGAALSSRCKQQQDMEEQACKRQAKQQKGQQQQPRHQQQQQQQQQQQPRKVVGKHLQQPVQAEQQQGQQQQPRHQQQQQQQQLPAPLQQPQKLGQPQHKRAPVQTQQQSRQLQECPMQQQQQQGDPQQQQLKRQLQQQQQQQQQQGPAQQQQQQQDHSQKLQQKRQPQRCPTACNTANSTLAGRGAEVTCSQLHPSDNAGAMSTAAAAAALPMPGRQQDNLAGAACTVHAAPQAPAVIRGNDSQQVQQQLDTRQSRPLKQPQPPESHHLMQVRLQPPALQLQQQQAQAQATSTVKSPRQPGLVIKIGRPASAPPGANAAVPAASPRLQGCPMPEAAAAVERVGPRPELSRAAQPSPLPQQARQALLPATTSATHEQVALPCPTAGAGSVAGAASAAASEVPSAAVAKQPVSPPAGGAGAAAGAGAGGGGGGGEALVVSGAREQEAALSACMASQEELWEALNTCQAARMHLEQARTDTQQWAAHGTVWQYKAAEHMEWQPAEPLAHIERRYPHGVSRGQLVLLLTPPGSGEPQVQMTLLEAVAHFGQPDLAQLQQVEAAWQQELNKQRQQLMAALGKVRGLMRQLALASAALAIARVDCSSWCWLNGPAGLDRKLLIWQQLLDHVAANGPKLNPAHINLLQQPYQQHQTKSTNLAAVQQQVAAAQKVMAVLQRDLPDAAGILSELPPFEDLTDCWLLEQGHTGAPMSISTLRQLVLGSSINPLNLVHHISEAERPVWVMDLVLLRLVDSSYDELQQEAEANMAVVQYPQQQERVLLPRGVQQQQPHAAWRSPPWQTAARRQQQVLSPRASQQQHTHPANQQKLQQQQHRGLPEPPSSAAAATAACTVDQPVEAPPAPATPPPAAGDSLPSAGGPPVKDGEQQPQQQQQQQLSGPLLNHVPSSILAVTFPLEQQLPYAWPCMPARARRLLRRFFEGCLEDSVPLPGDSIEDWEGEESELEELESAAPSAAGDMDQQGSAAASRGSCDSATELDSSTKYEALEAAVVEQPLPVSTPEHSKHEQQQQQQPEQDKQQEQQEHGQKPQQQQQQQRASAQRSKRRRAGVDEVSAALAEMDPETAAAVKEAMFGIRRGGRTAAEVPSVDQQPHKEQQLHQEVKPQQCRAAVSSSEPLLAQKQRHRRLGSPSPDHSHHSATPDSSEFGADSNSSSRQDVSGSHHSAAAATRAQQSRLARSSSQWQALAERDDIDEDTRAALQAAMLGLRSSRSSQQSELHAASLDVLQEQPLPPAQRHSKRPAAAASSRAASKPAKRSEGGKPPNSTARPGGCGRALDLAQLRRAASISKVQGFSCGLHAVLLSKRRMTNAAEAASSLPMENGFLLPVPYSLPVCLLSGEVPGAVGAIRLPSAGQSSSTEQAAASSRVGGGRRGQRSELRDLMRGELALSEAAKWKNLVARSKQVVFQRSGVHGWGLFAGEDIAADDFVIEYVGELIRPVLSDSREKMYEAAGQDSSYLFRIDNEWVADATVRGGRARFINHSCDPNCYTKIFTIDGTRKIGIYAKKPISPGEELAYDYKFDFEEEARKVPCACGAKNCRGFMN